METPPHSLLQIWQILHSLRPSIPSAHQDSTASNKATNKQGKDNKKECRFHPSKYDSSQPYNKCHNGNSPQATNNQQLTIEPHHQLVINLSQDINHHQYRSPLQPTNPRQEVINNPHLLHIHRLLHTNNKPHIIPRPM